MANMTIEQAIEILSRNLCEGCRLEDLCTVKSCGYKQALELAIESLRRFGLENRGGKQ